MVPLRSCTRVSEQSWKGGKYAYIPNSMGPGEVGKYVPTLRYLTKVVGTEVGK